MKIHEIHDLSNQHVVNLLSEHFNKSITDENLLKNYHPDNKNLPENLFYILRNGRYRKGLGKYYVIEIDNEYICSAGWNEYEFDKDIALLLTRMFVNEKYRAKYYSGNYILPRCIVETVDYAHCWITCNEYNKTIYDWFSRSAQGITPALYNNWPEIYRKFKPIGKKSVYFTDQYVAELEKEIR